MTKKSKRPRVAPQGKDFSKKDSEGVIVAEVDKAKDWDKGPTKIFNEVQLADKIW